MGHRLSAAVFFTVVTVLGFVASAGAVDGTIDINQAKVNAAGGFPYRITSGGSYRLTGNLTLPDNAVQSTAILVSGSNVTLDLNGFSIIGQGNIGEGNAGIVALHNIEVENGVLTGGLAIGVQAGTDSIVKNIVANSNGQGIIVGDRSKVKDCTTNSNTGGVAIKCSTTGCTITDNTVISNGVDGIDCTSNCLISGNAVNSNSGNGIRCFGSGCLITNNTINNNGTGIKANDASTSYGTNVLNGNTTSVGGGTSLGNGNTNLCSGTAC